MAFFFSPTYQSESQMDLAQVVPFYQDEEAYDLLGSYFADNVKGLPLAGRFTVSTEEGRMDLIAYRIYRSTDYWWVLMLYNDLLAPFEVVAGQVILYPSLSDLQNLFYSLQRLQAANDITPRAQQNFQQNLPTPTDLLLSPLEYNLGGFSYGDSGMFYGKLELTWTLDSVNETGINIYRMEDEESSFTLIAVVGGGVRSYSDSLLSYGHYWAYKIQAFNSFVVTPFSNIAAVDLTT